MYNNFFGFTERPFQLVPNPQYLYLSRSHEEAIAHLRYAISHGDGFVEITGEVGTGKTTLCRAFLEDLDQQAEVAYIFNPRLTSIELLRTINDEFGIPSEGEHIKDLIDTLNTFLMKLKREKKQAILLIDEAQNLDQDVLEQLRLLSNLETNTSKLLQIILVGQPELHKLLDAYSLRQLRQRITLSWYLTPLSPKETRGYIRHRVNIASKKSDDVFTQGAYNIIYKFSNGIPRLINIACDRMLLTAYGLNQKRVTSAIARAAVKELKHRGETRFFNFKDKRILVGAPALLVLLAAAFFFFRGLPTTSTTPLGSNASPASAPVSALRTTQTPNTSKTVTPPPARAIQTIKTIKEAEPQQVKTDDFGHFLGKLTSRASRLNALQTAFSQWEAEPRLDQYLDNIDNDTRFFQVAAAQNNFQLLAVLNEWDLVRRLNLPVIVAFYPPGGLSPRFLTVIKITASQIIFQDGPRGETISAAPETIRPYWSGKVFILWKNFLNCVGDIPKGAPEESVITLKMLLRDIGFKHLTMDAHYDDATREAVEEIQTRNGLEKDGIVGSRTKIVIYNEKKNLKIPHILTPPPPRN